MNLSSSVVQRDARVVVDADTGAATTAIGLDDWAVESAGAQTPTADCADCRNARPRQIDGSGWHPLTNDEKLPLFAVFTFPIRSGFVSTTKTVCSCRRHPSPPSPEKDSILSVPNTLHPLAPERHAGKRWLGVKFQEFAGNNPVLGLAMGELIAAMGHYPLAFVRDDEQGCGLVALAGLQQRQNLMIGADGQWLAPYIPALVRAYPFAVGRTEDGQQLLCVDERIALVEDGRGGERFFDDAGALAEPVRQVLDLLNQLEASRAVTATAVDALSDAGVLEPWTLQIEGLAPEHWLRGLLRINEAALNALPNDRFLELRHIGALPLAYGQMLSTGNLQKLVELARVRAQAEQAAAAQAPVQAVAQAAGGPDQVTADFSGDTFKFH